MLQVLKKWSLKTTPYPMYLGRHQQCTCDVEQQMGRSFWLVHITLSTIPLIVHLSSVRRQNGTCGSCIHVSFCWSPPCGADYVWLHAHKDRKVSETTPLLFQLVLRRRRAICYSSGGKRGHNILFEQFMGLYFDHPKLWSHFWFLNLSPLLCGRHGSFVQ